MNEKNQKLIEIGKELLEFHKKLIDHMTKNIKIDGKDIYRKIIFGIYIKTVKTFQAFLDLAKIGYNEDSDILARTILENMITLYYIKEEDSENRANLFVGYDLIDKEKTFKELMEFDDWYKKLLEKIDKEQLRYYKDIREKEKIKLENQSIRINHYSWSWKSFREMVKNIKNITFKHSYTSFRHLLCKSVHPSTFNIDNYCKIINNNIEVNDSPNPEVYNSTISPVINFFLVISKEIIDIFNCNNLLPKLVIIKNELDKFIKIKDKT